MAGTMTQLITASDSSALAAVVAADLLDLIEASQDAGGVPKICLTGGRIAGQVNEAIRSHPEVAKVDWKRVSWWWSDERFVAPDSPQRNEGQARELLLHHVGYDPDLVHPMPANDGHWASIEMASEWYADQISKHCPTGFDLVLLSIGEDGHVASLFPGSKGLTTTDTVAMAIIDSPKPPPERITLTRTALAATRNMWFLAAGVEKAKAVAGVLTQADRRLPATQVAELVESKWFVDHQAAEALKGVNHQDS